MAISMQYVGISTFSDKLLSYMGSVIILLLGNCENSTMMEHPIIVLIPKHLD